MSDKPLDTITVELQSLSGADEYLGKGWMPSADFRLLTSAADGPADPPWHDASLASQVLSGFLRSVERILENEDCTVEIDMGEVQFTPVPESDAVEVWVAIDGVPRERRSDDPDLVDRTALVRELYTSVRAWYEKGREINPEITNVDWFQEIEIALADAEAALDEAGIDMSD